MRIFGYTSSYLHPFSPVSLPPSILPCGLTSLPGDKAKEAFVSSAREFHVFHDTPKTMVDGVSKIGKFEIVARVASKGCIARRRRGTIEWNGW